ncbi:MAG: hypothetical protein RJA81_1551 [Planctomycetota bacterium]
MSQPNIQIDGLVANPISLAFTDLATMPETSQVHDVSRFASGKKGDAVTLESLLSLVDPQPEANYLTLHANRDDFHVSIPLEAVRSEGLLVYKLGDSPLEVSQGGPFRFLIRDFTACHSSELDDCANVKFLDRIELTHRKQRDTRPQSEAEHKALHAREMENHDF